MADRYNVAITPKIEERFWAKVAKGRRSECWPWTGARNSCGYGSFGFRGTVYAAHQIALIVAGFQRPQPPFHCALHNCDNPACCNPDHLRWGSQQENVAERDERRGNYHRKGVRTTPKLTEEQARYVLASPKLGYVLANELGVHKATISDIRCGKTWKELRGGSVATSDCLL